MRMPKFVYHYTSLDALRGILNQEDIVTPKGNKKESLLTFWGSRYDCMNDPQDFTFASKVVLPRIQRFLKMKSDIGEELRECNEMFPYIVSFSETKDDESMWNNYHAEVCLELDTQYLSPWIVENGIIKGFWGRCIYARENEIDDKFLEAWKGSLHSIENIHSMAQHACVYIKRKAFEREKEWRLYLADEIMAHVQLDGSSYYTEQPQDVKIKCIRDKDIVFYKEFKIDYKALKKIIINDTDWEHFHKVKKHIEILLESKGFCSDDIVIEQTDRYPIEK